MLKPQGNSSGRKYFSLLGKLAHCWTGPYKVLVVGPGELEVGQGQSVPIIEKVGPKLLLLDIKKEEPGGGITQRTSVSRCKKCYNLHEGQKKPRSLPWNMSEYILNK